jgi:hypothetical protein
MTAADLLDACHARGVGLFIEGGRLRYRAPAGALDADLLAALKARRDELLEALHRPAPEGRPDPPPGARLFFLDGRGRPGGPDGSYLWTWEGAARWYYTARHAPPPFDLVLRPGYSKGCASCVRQALRLSWQEFTNGTKHLRCDCGVCGRFVAHIGPPPKNPDVEYRVVKNQGRQPC